MERTPIVCALDQSDAARSTLERAVALARWEEVALHVVHVLPDGTRPLRASHDAVPPDALEASAHPWLADCPVLTVPASGEVTDWPTATTRLDADLAAAGGTAVRM